MAKGTGRAKELLGLLLIAVTYFAAAKLGMSLAFATKQVTAVWPPTGVAFVALLLIGLRAWPGVFLGAFLANVTANETVSTALGIACGNTLAGVLGVLLVKRVAQLDRRLARPRDVLSLIVLGAGVACTVSASGGVLNLALGGIVPWSAFGSVWWVWWVGDALGVLLIAPLLLAWLAQPRLQYSQSRSLELLLLLTTLLGICFLTFAGPLADADQQLRLEYAVFPFVIWAALRFGQREAATAAVIVAGFAVYGAIHGQGPFASGPLDRRLVLLDLFMATAATTGLMLGALVAERRRAERELQTAHAELEQRVAARTAELAHTNAELAKKNEEVEAFVYIVSHDLRAPLVNLQGFTGELSLSCAELGRLLEVAQLPPERQAELNALVTTDIPTSLRFISASTSKFQRLIDALLALSRYGRQPFNPELVDVEKLVEGTLASLQGSIKEHAAHVSVGMLPSIRGDATALGQVFSNLIVNALKYGKPGQPGEIEIGGRLEADTARYWVRDNGSGIPRAAQHRLFQVFQRFHPNLASGEGMGLAIVKRVIERHGGSISAESEEGLGTTFHLSLPALRPGRT